MHCQCVLTWRLALDREFANDPADAARAAAIAGQRKEVIRNPKTSMSFRRNRLVLVGPRLPWTCPEWTSGNSGVFRSMKEFRDEN